MAEKRSGSVNFNKPNKWRICHLLMALPGHKYGAENGKKNETDTLGDVQSQSGTGNDGWGQDTSTRKSGTDA